MGTQYLSEIRIMSFGFAPKGWVQCNGQILPISQNQALFALLGTTYGGNGQTTFALPNLQGRVPISFSTDGQYSLGQVGGEAAHTLAIPELPQHNHALMADATTAADQCTSLATSSSVLGKNSGKQTPSGSFNVALYNAGAPDAILHPNVLGRSGAQPHENMQPYLTLNFCIALQGIFPSRN